MTPLNANSPRLPSPWRTHPVAEILRFGGLTAALFCVLALPLLAVFRFTHTALDPNSEHGGLIAHFCLAVAGVTAYGIVARRRGRSLTDAGLPPMGVFSETGLGLLVGGGVFSAAIMAMSAFRCYDLGAMNPHFRPFLPLALFLCIGVFQEVAMRGCIFQALERRWGSGIALVASCLFFGLIHLGSPVEGLSTGQWLIGPFFLAFETGLLFTAGYLLTRRLWLPIGLHWGWNFFETAIYGTANSGAWENNPNSLFEGHAHGPFLLTGGAFGPEASVFCLLVGFYAGTVLLRLAIRRGHWRPAHAANQVK